MASASTSFLMAGDLRAVMYSRPGIRDRSSLMRAWVIIPRSPTSTTRVSPKRWRSLSIWVATVVGSPVFPLNTSTATVHPSGSLNSP